ncbi:MAG: histone deacetylase family protein [Syntrophobacteria bacterium]
MLRVIYHPAYENDFMPGSFEGPARIQVIRRSLEAHFSFLTPDPAPEENLCLVHDQAQVARVKSSPLLFETVLLAVGGAIRCCELAMTGQPAFGLIRPPGHHADRSESWGFCYINNMAVAIARLLAETDLQWIVIMDLDHHVGDGTQRIFVSQPEVSVINIVALEREHYLEHAGNILRLIRKAELLAVSMGFDTYERDLGGLLKTEDYRFLGMWLREASERLCQGRRFAILEGGYYLPDLGKNVLAFCEGFG